MASNYIERFIKIFVNNDAAVNDLKQTEQALNKVDSSAKKVEKTMGGTTKAVLDNGGAMGILNELTGGLAMTFKDASEAVGLAGVSLNSFKGIMISTGIGALVIAVGYLAANWKDVSESIGLSNKNLEEYNELQKKANAEIIKRETNLSTIVNAIDSLLKESVLNVNALNSGLKQLSAIIPNIDKFDITNPKDLDTVKGLVEAAKSLNSLQEQTKVETEFLVSLRNQLKETNNSEIQLNKIQLQQAENLVSVMNNDNSYTKRVDAEKELKSLLGEEYKTQILINQTRFNADRLKRNELRVEGEIEKITGAKLKLLDDKKKTDEKAIKDQQDYNNLLKSEIEITKQLKQIREDIDKIVGQNRTTEAERYVTTLNKEYAQVKALLAVQEDLNKRLQTAQDLKAKATGTPQEALQQREINNITKLIAENDKLIKQRQQEIQDKLAADQATKLLNDKRQDEIRLLQSLANIQSIRGNEFDALILNIDAYQLERKAIEDNVQARIELNKVRMNEIETELATQGLSVERRAELERAKNDLARESTDLEIELGNTRLETELATNEMSLEMYRAFIDEKTAMDDEYYNNLMITSSNLQGFLSQLQDENLIKSKDLRNVLLVAEKGLAIANVVIDTIRANKVLKGRAIDQTTAGNAALATAIFTNDPRAYASAGLHFKAAATSTAGIALNTVSAGAAIGGILATTLTSWNRSAGSGSGGGTGGAGGAGGAPEFNIVGSSGTNQLAATIAARQNQPVNAYVVGTDVSTQQSLDRNRITNATFLSLIPWIGLFVMFI
jgi:hypothetical protein